MIVPLLVLCLQGQSCAAAAPDPSDFLGLLLAVEAAGPTLFGGIKMGVPVAVKGDYPRNTLRTVTLDLGYDRLQQRGRFCGELSMLLPVARFPAPRNADSTYVRVYVEPGAGYRGGGGGLGSYASAKAMLAFFSDARLTKENAPPSFFLEIQRRFPLAAPLRGDTRLVMGLMVAICNHCGLN
jgi:hypothetical protein